jgi:hypothetical protein
MDATEATDKAHSGEPSDLDLDRILPWYSGRALEVMRDRILPILREAREIGCWPRGGSRGVRAALNKQTVAARWGRDHEGAMRSVRAPGDLDGGRGEDGFYLAHAMRFGSFALAPGNLALAARLLPHAGGSSHLVGEAARWAADFAPIARLVELLDSRRPRPTIVVGTLSPLVLRNVGTAIGVDLASIRCPEIEYEWKEIEISVRGVSKIIRVCEGRILWPDGTRHGLSRFGSGNQCHACGHRISNPFNWVPLVADATHPAMGPGPASLWVGRDCAKRLFNCDASGDAVYPSR